MITQKWFLRVIEIKGWEPVRSNASTFTLERCYAHFTFKEHPAFICQVAYSQIARFRERIVDALQRSPNPHRQETAQ